ncbi:hypothetical protein D3C71_1201630 [compost metagenome]
MILEKEDISLPLYITLIFLRSLLSSTNNSISEPVSNLAKEFFSSESKRLYRVAVDNPTLLKMLVKCSPSPETTITLLRLEANEGDITIIKNKKHSAL